MIEAPQDGWLAPMAPMLSAALRAVHSGLVDRIMINGNANDFPWAQVHADKAHGDLTEEMLDDVPGMRRLERLARTWLIHVPVHDSIDGEANAIVTRRGIGIMLQFGSDHIETHARHDGTGWTVTSHLHVHSREEVCETDALLDNGQSLLESVYRNEGRLVRTESLGLDQAKAGEIVFRIGNDSISNDPGDHWRTDDGTLDYMEVDQNDRRDFRNKP